MGVMIAATGCATRDRSADVSPATRRSLTDAIRAGEAGGAPLLDGLRDAAQQAPRDAVAQERYGLAAEQAALYPEALAALDRAVALDGTVAAWLAAQGRIALETGDVPAASRAYTRALALDPGNIDALDGLGVAADLQRDHVSARERYNAALRLAPRDWKVRSNLAMSLLMSGNASEAAGVLAGAGEDPAAPRRARHDLALALVASGRRGQAISVLETDMPASEAAALADEFAGFAQWLASPEGSRPTTR